MHDQGDASCGLDQQSGPVDQGQHGADQPQAIPQPTRQAGDLAQLIRVAGLGTVFQHAADAAQQQQPAQP